MDKLGWGGKGLECGCTNFFFLDLIEDYLVFGENWNFLGWGVVEGRGIIIRRGFRRYREGIWGKKEYIFWIYGYI